MKKRNFVLTIFVLVLFSLSLSCGGSGGGSGGDSGGGNGGANGGGGGNGGGIDDENAELFLLPANQTVNIGERFWIDVTLDTNDQAVTAVAAYITFPPNLLKVDSINTADSDLGVEAENTVQDNLIKIARGKQTPGINSPSVLVATINFTAVAQGTAEILYQLNGPGEGPSRVIEDNGLGTDILTKATGGNYTIDP